MSFFAGSQAGTHSFVDLISALVGIDGRGHVEASLDIEPNVVDVGRTCSGDRRCIIQALWRRPSAKIEGTFVYFLFDGTPR